MQAPTLTGYGGVGEIGGNAFLLDDGRTRILLDAGRRFGAATVKHQLPESYVRRPGFVGSSRVDLQACKLEYSIVSPK